MLPSDVDEAFGFALCSVEEELGRRTRAWVGVLRAIARWGCSLISTRMDILSLCYAAGMRASGVAVDGSLQTSTCALAGARSFTLAGELVDHRTPNCLTVQLAPECLQGFLDGALTNATDVEIGGWSGDCQKIHHAAIPMASGFLGRSLP